MTSENAAVVRRVFQATNAKDVDAVRACYAPTFRVNGAAMNFETLAASFPAFFAAFPDAEGTIDDLVAAGDHVAARWTTTATHAAEYAGAPATGKHVRWSGINIYGFRGAKIVDVWQTADLLGLLRQIGALPDVFERPATRRRQARSPSPLLIQMEVKPSGNGAQHPQGGPT